MRLSITTILILLLVTAGSAQDSQYWNNHYGKKGILLGGAVIGSVEDLSAVFYNPGYLGLKANPGLEIGSGVFDLSYLRVSTDSLNIEPLVAANGQLAPGIVAGQVEFVDNATNHFTYSLIGRQALNFYIMGRSKYTDSAGRLTDLEISLDQRYFDHWGGVTWSRQLSEHWGAGVSLFGALRFQRRRENASISGTRSDGSPLLTRSSAAGITGT